jgi:acyl-coenzyme A synthetase/AMP-(fatty) acid ligase
MAEPLDMLSVLTAARSPGRPVAWRLGNAVCWAEFITEVKAWRTLLRRTSGQSFALFLADTVEFAAALFGAWQAGKTIYVPGDRLPASCGALREIVDGYLGDFASEWDPKMPKPQDFAAGVDEFERLDPKFNGLVLYTSGTSGAAQAIPKMLSQMSAEVATLENQFGSVIGIADILATVSHQHIYGLLFNVLWPLSAGRVIQARSFSFLEEVTATLLERECVLVSSPAHLKRLPQNQALTMASKRLRAVFSSGGPLSLEVAQQSERLLGQVPIEVYGSSESGGIAWRQQRTERDQGWKPLPGVEWRVDADESVLEVRSAHLPDSTWFRMADRAAPADDQHFLLTGRVDRIAKIEGKRISLGAIEGQLKASRLVRDARVLGVERRRRQQIAAFIVPSEEGRRKLIEDGKLFFNRMLRQQISSSVELIGIPRLWRYLDALPINAQGKTTHAELVALLRPTSCRPIQPLERLLERNERRAVFQLIAPPALLYFDGHFPDRPILAGVVQIDWAIALGRRCFDLPPAFQSIQGLKFQRMIPPGLPVTLELIYDPAKSCLSFKSSSELGSHAGGRIFFGAAHV